MWEKKMAKAGRCRRGRGSYTEQSLAAEIDFWFALFFLVSRPGSWRLRVGSAGSPPWTGRRVPAGRGGRCAGRKRVHWESIVLCCNPRQSTVIHCGECCDSAVPAVWVSLLRFSFLEQPSAHRCPSLPITAKHCPLPAVAHCCGRYLVSTVRTPALWQPTLIPSHFFFFPFPSLPFLII